MADGKADNSAPSGISAEEWLACAQELAPRTLNMAREVTEFPVKWKMIISKLEQIPSRLSDLSTHPLFSKNTLCNEQLQTVCVNLKEAIELANSCLKHKYEGKLQMQSSLDALVGKLDMNLRDCGLLIKTGVLGDAPLPSKAPDTSVETEAAGSYRNLCDLFARLQIGHLESKHKALDSLMEVMKKDENNVVSVIRRSNITALVQLLTATSPKIREKTVTVICWLAESGRCEDWLVSEGVLPPLIRLIESGNSLGHDKAIVALRWLSMSPETCRSIVGHGGVRPLIEICENGESVLQATATCTLKNLSVVPETRQTLADEGIIKVMIHILRHGALLGSKEYAAECLQNLTSSSDALKRRAVAEGGFQSLLAYLDGPLPQEAAACALRNLVTCVSPEVLMSSGVVRTLAHVLKSGSAGAQQASASAICQICISGEMKRYVGEGGCIPLLVRMLEAKGGAGREVAAQAVASLMTVPSNCREVKKDDKSIPNLVALLNPSPQNTAKKYAVFCLGSLSSSSRCKKLMISYGAIGYLKKLTDSGVPGAKKLLDRLERGKIKSLFLRG